MISSLDFDFLSLFLISLLFFPFSIFSCLRHRFIFHCFLLTVLLEMLSGSGLFFDEDFYAFMVGALWKTVLNAISVENLSQKRRLYSISDERGFIRTACFPYDLEQFSTPVPFKSFYRISDVNWESRLIHRPCQEQPTLNNHRNRHKISQTGHYLINFSCFSFRALWPLASSTPNSIVLSQFI